MTKSSYQKLKEENDKLKKQLSIIVKAFNKKKS